MIVKTKRGDVYLGRIKIIDLMNGYIVYFGSDIQAAIKSFNEYEEETEGDWFPENKLFYYDTLTRYSVGYRNLTYSDLLYISNHKDITV